MPLFVVLCDGMTLDDGLAARIKRRIRVDCSAAARPRRDPPDREVPRTLSGKPTEVPVKRILMGQHVEHAISRDALANPHALDTFIALAQGGFSSKLLQP